jgi:hypothetical protein
VSSTYTPSANRRWPRHHFHFPGRVIFRRGEEIVILDSLGSEVNEGGICVLADTELCVGQRIEIELTTPRSAPVKVQGVVRNRRGYSYGIAFLPNTIEERYETLKSFLRCKHVD